MTGSVQNFTKSICAAEIPPNDICLSVIRAWRRRFRQLVYPGVKLFLYPPTVGEFCGECRVCRQVYKCSILFFLSAKRITQGGILQIDSVREILHSLSRSHMKQMAGSALFLRFDEANQKAQ
jgi:hypothetical protein